MLAGSRPPSISFVGFDPFHAVAAGAVGGLEVAVAVQLGGLDAVLLAQAVDGAFEGFALGTGDLAVVKITQEADADVADVVVAGGVSPLVFDWAAFVDGAIAGNEEMVADTGPAFVFVGAFK